LNQLIINFYLTSQYFQVMEQVERYNLDSLVADVGGYLGLLLGASILSLFDFFVHYLGAKAKEMVKA